MISNEAEILQDYSQISASVCVVLLVKLLILKKDQCTRQEQAAGGKALLAVVHLKENVMIEGNPVLAKHQKGNQTV